MLWNRTSNDFSILLNFPPPEGALGAASFTQLVGVQDNVLYGVIPAFPSAGSEGVIIDGGVLGGYDGGGVDYGSTMEVNSTMFTVDCGSLPDAKQVESPVLDPSDASLSDIISHSAATYQFELGGGSNYTVAVNPIREWDLTSIQIQGQTNRL